MWQLFRKKQSAEPEPEKSIWKEDFSDCSTLDYLPDFSICKCQNHKHCRYIAMFAGMLLCSNPRHKEFIIEGSEPFDPHKYLF